MHYTYIIFSLIFLLFLSLTFILGVQKNLSKEIKFCINKSSNLQHSHRKTTQKLFAKNNYALSLRTAREAAEATYKAAPAYAKAAAWAALQAVKALQKALTFYQKSLIYSAKVQSYQVISSMFSHSYFTEKTSTGLIVEAYPDDSDSPSYRLQDNYQDKKTVVFYKYINLLDGMPKLLKQHAISQTFYIKKFRCGATLSMKGDKPSKIKLILDK